MKKIVIAAGGTGGHIFPALALAERLSREEDVSVSFIGAGDMERYLVAPRFPLKNLPIKPFRPSPRKVIHYLLSFIISLLSALLSLMRDRPDVVIGMGGYPTVPTLLSAIFLRIPFIIHEQNIIPGRVNSLFGQLASKILISFPDTKRFFPSNRTKCIGLPLRSSLQKIDKQTARKELRLNPDKFTLLVSGGSRGALSINNALIDILPLLLNDGMQIIHLCGSKHFQDLRKKTKDWNGGYLLLPFSEEMHLLYSSADLCVCRAGASTLAELAFFALPSILIPYPYAVSEHQLLNALYYQKMGASVVIRDENLKEPFLLYENITYLADSPERLAQMSASASSLAKPRAVEDAVKEIREVIER
ncbi:undecaprenyldiphospho-muramoylpentapeptide beta-N-acetylglucosaminyltransferase [bacterium]|nr:undecaprenyldiphospho-muramoylpentapeptide beta-N-acetylglucosaminyltransferase [bacterium]